MVPGSIPVANFAPGQRVYPAVAKGFEKLYLPGRISRYTT